jgi:hypothetical protein
MYMVDRIKHYTLSKPKLKRFVGWFLVVFGFFLLVTPLTPGGTLFFVGLELLGLRIIGVEKVKRFMNRTKSTSTPPPILGETVS